MILECSFPTCTFTTGDIETAAAVALLQNHSLYHQQQQQQQQQPQQPQQAAAPSNRSDEPKLGRPTVKSGITKEEWNAFTRRWNHYRTGHNIPDNKASTQLLECAALDLSDIVLRAHPLFGSKPIDEALKLL